MQPITPSAARTVPPAPAPGHRAPGNWRASADEIALLVLVLSLVGMLVSFVLLVVP